MFAEWMPKEQMNETPWSIYECPPYIERHHSQLSIWIQTLPSPNSYLWLEAQSLNTNNRDQRVTEKSSKQTNKWQPRKEGIVIKTISLVLKELEQSRIVLAASPARIHILGLSKCQFACYLEYNY